jgi:glycosyltransferase involved in cell wall biosynthesis
VNTSDKWPRISIVVPSFNQGHFLTDTLQSLVDQEYPDLEVIIQDGCSSDNSLEVAQRFKDKYPNTFKVFVQKDRNHAHALNLGFAHVSGEIFGFLNSDDTLYPGVLRQVAREIDPALGRWIVMGRSLFTGDSASGEDCGELGNNGAGPRRDLRRYIGYEHPCEFKGHFDTLAIWKTGMNRIPQPSVFWHRSVWDKCGGLDEATGHALDYELFCRFSKYFVFHRIDQLWSTYRLHNDAKTAKLTEREVVDIAIAATRQHWGPWWSILRWRCESSWYLHNPVTLERGRDHARLAENALRAGDPGSAAARAIRTAICSPVVFWRRWCQPFLMIRVPQPLEKVLLRASKDRDASPRFDDGWIGPNYAEAFEIPQAAAQIVFRINYCPPKRGKSVCRFLLDGLEARRIQLAEQGVFEVGLGVETCAGNRVLVQILSSSSFRPFDYSESADKRWLALLVEDVRFI